MLPPEEVTSRHAWLAFIYLFCFLFRAPSLQSTAVPAGPLSGSRTQLPAQCLPASAAPPAASAPQLPPLPTAAATTARTPALWLCGLTLVRCGPCCRRPRPLHLLKGCVSPLHLPLHLPLPLPLTSHLHRPCTLTCVPGKHPSQTPEAPACRPCTSCCTRSAATTPCKACSGALRPHPGPHWLPSPAPGPPAPPRRPPASAAPPAAPAPWRPPPQAPLPSPRLPQALNQSRRSCAAVLPRAAGLLLLQPAGGKTCGASQVELILVRSPAGLPRRTDLQRETVSPRHDSG